MTRFTVVWQSLAPNELASIWLNAAGRQSVTLAANAIDRHLATNAIAKGIQVKESLRELTVPPLRVVFAASDEDRLVRVRIVGTE
jgi:hypothetical protein